VGFGRGDSLVILEHFACISQGANVFLSDTAIRRPVLASMMSLALVIFGAIGYTRLPVREYPDVDAPIVSVSTTLRGANPRVIESTITDILEEELSTIEGIRTITSASREQVSSISSRWSPSRTPTLSRSCGSPSRPRTTT
jgi:multidrug efflux pump